VPAADLELPGRRWWPRTVAVLEGAAKAAPDAPDVDVLRADRDGDRAIVETVQAAGEPERLTVVTADRALRESVTALGARVLGPGRAWELMDAAVSAARSTSSS
jgi:hypothetical protein